MMEFSEFSYVRTITDKGETYLNVFDLLDFLEGILADPEGSEEEKSTVRSIVKSLKNME